MNVVVKQKGKHLPKS